MYKGENLASNDPNQTGVNQDRAINTERKTIVSSVSNTNKIISECLNVLESIISDVRGSSPACDKESAQSPHCLLGDIDILQKKSEGLLKSLYCLKEYVS